MCECVCWRERKSERKRGRFTGKRQIGKDFVCVCVRERETETERTKR